MRISAIHSNVEYMRLKLDTLMAIYPWVEMVVFSELAAFGPLTQFAQEIPGPAEAEFQKMAKQHGIWLIPGSIFEKRDFKTYNTLSVINPEGEVIARYNKMFPFLPYEENVTSGNEFVLFDVPDVGRFGVSICYDMWFPETSRTLAVNGAEVIIHPSLTGTIDRGIELAIVQATAATNQCYFFDINGLGAGGNGKSIICGPDGRVIYQAGEDEELIPIEVDLERVRRSREIGVLRLGQPLKSFRDNAVHFDVYDNGKKFPYLNKLGKLEKPKRMRVPTVWEEFKVQINNSETGRRVAHTERVIGEVPLPELPIEYLRDSHQEI